MFCFWIKDVPVRKEVPFEINTAAAGKAPVRVNIGNPKGQNVPCFVAEKPGGYNAKFTPFEPGPHTVQVLFADQPVPGSPFTVRANPVSFKFRIFPVLQLNVVSYVN